MTENLDKHTIAYTHLLKIKHGLGDNVLLVSRFNNQLKEYFLENGFFEVEDFNLYVGYGYVTLSTNNEKLLLLAKLGFQ